MKPVALPPGEGITPAACLLIRDENGVLIGRLGWLFRIARGIAMKILQRWFVVLVMVGALAGGFRESHGADPMPGVIAQDKGDPQRDAAVEEPAATPLTINRTGPEPPLAVAPFDAEQARKQQKEWAEHLGLPVELTNSIGMQLALIPAGEFLMGWPPTRSSLLPEKPQHLVRITQPFYLGIHEVTQEQYARVIGRNPSHFKGAQLPVETVSWEEAVEFCARLSALPAEKAAGRAYRLPTEAEWEYACRATLGRH
jgi:hypothetical protein